MTKIQVDSNGKAIMLGSKALVASEGGVTPTGTLSITANGTYDVTDYASANVSVSGGGNRKIAPYNCTIEYFDELPFTKSSDESISTDNLPRLGTFNFSKSDMIPVSYADGATYIHAYLNPSYDNSNGHTIYDFDSEQYYTKTVIRTLYSNPADCPPVLNFGAITTITLSGACQNSTYLEKVLFPNVTSLSIKNSFLGCTNLSVIDMPKVNTLPSGAFLGTSARGAFQGTAIQTLSFPALTSTSFGSYTNQFNNMLRGVAGCTVHFPSNLQSVIGSWTSVTSGFGGTNTTVLFDLPATT